MTVEKYWFGKGILFSRKYFRWLIRNPDITQKKTQHYFSPEYMQHLIFSGLNLQPGDILLFAYTAAFLTFLCCMLIGLCIVLVYHVFGIVVDLVTFLLMSVLIIILPVIILNLIASYPKTLSHYIKIQSLGDIPEVLSYLVMYLKLVPNLENSVKFAAQESSTALAHDLRKMIWNMEIRIYHGIDDAITNFAIQWGKWSDYFKRSLHLLRNSIHERDDASRMISLTRALDVSLDGTRDSMTHFASKLQQPTMIIYAIGIMIPLSLIAMLPAVGLIGMHITIVQVFLVYDIFLPLLLFLYMRKILLHRPAAFHPPSIPHQHPDIIRIKRKKQLLFACIIGGCIASPGLLSIVVPAFFSEHIGGADPLMSQGFADFFALFPVTLFIFWGVAAAVFFYTTTVYQPEKKVRDEIKQIEKEFSDALFILGKRIAEEKSPEECFLYAAQTMSGAKIAPIFRKTSYNLIAQHTNLREAFFNAEYGSLKHVYSTRIKAILRLFVEGIQKSQHAVSISIIKIADHLKELQAVERKIKETLSELTATLRSTAAIFAPLIAGVTLAITQMITSILGSMRQTIPADDILYDSPLMGRSTSSLYLVDVVPEYLIFVIGIYIIELVCLLVRFSNGIDEGDDKIAYYHALGRALPVAVLVLSITIGISQFFFHHLLQTL